MPEARVHDLVEAAKAHIRAKIENPFRVIKKEFDCRKACLSLIAMNHCNSNALAALKNLFLISRQLIPIS